MMMYLLVRVATTESEMFLSVLLGLVGGDEGVSVTSILALLLGFNIQNKGPVIVDSLDTANPDGRSVLLH